jgi:hypothetical protein
MLAPVLFTTAYHNFPLGEKNYKSRKESCQVKCRRKIQKWKRFFSTIFRELTVIARKKKQNLSKEGKRGTERGVCRQEISGQNRPVLGLYTAWIVTCK